MKNDLAEKQAKREAEVARKIVAAFAAQEQTAEAKEVGGRVVISVGDVTLLLDPSLRARVGTWIVREPNECVDTEIYCPSTHDVLRARDAASLQSLIRRIEQERKRKSAYAERTKIIEACRARVASIPREDGSSFARVIVEARTDYYGKPADVAKFSVSVSMDRAEEFAAIVASFFGC